MKKEMDKKNNQRKKKGRGISAVAQCNSEVK
jgi:hypothetical protein